LKALTNALNSKLAHACHRSPATSSVSVSYNRAYGPHVRDGRTHGDSQWTMGVAWFVKPPHFGPHTASWAAPRHPGRLAKRTADVGQRGRRVGAGAPTGRPAGGGGRGEGVRPRIACVHASRRFDSTLPGEIAGSVGVSRARAASRPPVGRMAPAWSTTALPGCPRYGETRSRCGN
jgi:hypothetical protein